MSILIEPLREEDLSTADAILRWAFGKLFGLHNVAEIFGDVEYVRTRWAAAPDATLRLACGSLHGAMLSGPCGAPARPSRTSIPFSFCWRSTATCVHFPRRAAKTDQAEAQPCV
jgi:hypothetical protein